MRIFSNLMVIVGAALILLSPLAVQAGANGIDDDEIEVLELVGRGARLLPGATTDVWVLDDFAYIGTFQSPCGDGTGDNGSGIRIFDVDDLDEVTEVGFLPSVLGSRSNDVKVMEMNSGTILVHSNEACVVGGPGGFEIWEVDDDDPVDDPVHLAHVQTDDVNAFLRAAPFDFVNFGVHNLFLFTQDDKDFVAAVVESEFGNFQIFDITDPTLPELVGFWGAEELRMVELGFDPATVPDLDGDDFGLILELDAWLFSGFGVSQNRFLHDITITGDDEDDIGEDATRAYLSNWDAGLVLLDISDPTDPTLVSVALDPAAGSLDGEVNSHAAWPTEDGTVVVEGEEDFSPFELTFTIDDGPNAGEFPAVEGAITTPIVSLPGLTMSGPTVYVGFACEGSVFDPGPPFDDPVPSAPTPDSIAVIQRGGCFFSEKIDNADAAGYAGVVVFNSAAGGDAVFVMGGAPVNLPGVFVGHSTGLAIFDVPSAADLVISMPGAPVSAAAVPQAWGGLRIWDYSDPANPILASVFNTVCSANPADASCDLRGTYTAHNIIVEGNKVFISWYSDGVLVLDISDPFNPVEIARFNPVGPEFEAQNGGIQDVWGIFKIPGEDEIFASDRNGGLYVLELTELEEDDEEKDDKRELESDMNDRFATETGAEGSVKWKAISGGIEISKLKAKGLEPGHSYEIKVTFSVDFPSFDPFRVVTFGPFVADDDGKLKVEDLKISDLDAGNYRVDVFVTHIHSTVPGSGDVGELITSFLDRDPLLACEPAFNLDVEEEEDD